MSDIITEIQDKIHVKLEAINGVNYVDEDWGQLDYYSPNFPVKWPCVLTDIDATYKDIGLNKTTIPMQRQIADATLSLTIANLKLNNSSSKAPQLQKNNTRSINNLIEDIHKELQGYNANEQTGQLIRRIRRRVKRDDGVQEYNITYIFKVDNV